MTAASFLGTDTAPARAMFDVIASALGLAGGGEVVVALDGSAAVPAGPRRESLAALVLNVDDPVLAAVEAGGALVRVGLDGRAGFRAENSIATLKGTTFELVADGERLAVRLRLIGEQFLVPALSALAAAQALGASLPAAIAALEALESAGEWRMQSHRSPRGAIVLNDAHDATPDSAAAALRTLAQVLPPGDRSIAVLGELGSGDVEENDRIGRLAVRLNVRYLVCVGAATRHIHSAAGLEGSWNGESVLVATASEAYDLLRDELREGDVMLVKSSASAALGALGDALAGVTA